MIWWVVSIPPSLMTKQISLEREAECPRSAVVFNLTRLHPGIVIFRF